MRQLHLGFLEVVVADQILGHPDLELAQLRVLRQLDAGPRFRIVSVQFQRALIQPASLRELRRNAGRIPVPKKALDHMLSLQAQFGSQKRTVWVFPHRLLDLGQPGIPSPGIDIRHPLVE